LARSPNNNRPDRQPENARARRRIVLRQMLKNGFITQEEFEQADAESLLASLQTQEEKEASLNDEGSEWRPNEFLAPYFCEATRIHLRQEGLVNKEALLESGLEIHTTIDLELQEKVQAIMESHLQQFDDDKLAYLQRAGREEEFVPVSGALVLIDNRPGMQGFVRAMFGGRDFEKEKFNTATQAQRQPGSSVKPFVWTTALTKGMRPSSIEMDMPLTIMVGTGKYWTPRNFGGGFSGPTTLRRALERSVNIVSVRLVRRYGLSAVRDTLQQMGIRTPIPDNLGLTIALGSLVVNPLEHCSAYATFANGGVYYPPVLVSERRNRDGITEYKARPKGTRVLDAQIAYLMTNIMEGVAVRGTGARSRALERPRAGKTGTTNDARDVWFCGFTPQFTCVVWMGYRDYRSLGAGRGFTGGRLACPIWTEVMIEAHKDLPVLEFEVPQGIAFHGSGPGFREAYLKDDHWAPETAPIEGQTGPMEAPGRDAEGAPTAPQTPEEEEEELEDLFGPLFEGFNT
jgi:penicillin-binding protein 1A